LLARATTFAQQIPSEEWAYSFRNRFCIDHPGIGNGLISGECKTYPTIDEKGDHLVLCSGFNVWTIATHDHAVREFVAACQYAATDRFTTPYATLDPDPNGKITRQTGDIMVCQLGF
jgi:hypothetical protein